MMLNIINFEEGALQHSDKRVQVLPYSEQNAARWDEFVARAPMATFLHSRRYLSYHGDRFMDVSLLVEDNKQRLVGLLPAAVDPALKTRVVSHPGITYGGMLHDGRLRGEQMVEALSCVRSYYAAQGFASLRYKAVPVIYHQAPSADDSYALFRHGAVRYRCDLSCAIDLAHRQVRSERRKRGLKKSLKEGIQISEGADFIEPLWEVVTDNLTRKYGLKPVHSVSEIMHLASLFPENIRFVVALREAHVVAGVVLFVTAQAIHAQYTASSTTGYDVCALDAVFEHCLAQATSTGMRYFDFGNSNEQEGRVLNTDLYQFKSEFGASGAVHDFYELGLTQLNEELTTYGKSRIR